MTGMYLIGTMFALALPRTSQTRTTRTNTLADVVSGLKYVRRDTAILLIVVFGVIHVVCGQPFTQLMAVFTEDILEVGARGLGILTSVSGAGAFCGALVMASLPNRKRGLILLFSGLIMGLSVTAFSWSHWWYLSLAIMPFAGLGPTMHMTMTATLVQYYTEPDYRGRMQSLVMMGQGLASLGTFLAGVLAEAIGIQWAVGGMALVLTVITLLYYAFARQVTRLE
jgi:MFS family permease